ncbi:uncharacterized protein LOC144360024 [Saccoglossus kowalevskii]
MALDQQKIVMLVLLDLSAALDTVDHSLLLARMSSGMGVAEAALSYFESHLSDQQQKVCIYEPTSSLYKLKYGVPQGSTNDIDINICHMESAIKDIHNWLTLNFLKLNSDKTEMLLFGSRPNLAKLNLPSKQIEGCTIVPTTSARKLGVEFDKHIGKSCEKYL